MKYDFLLVGAGLFSATFAHLANQSGKSCLILEKKSNIGGNCFTENIHGINVHKFGPHIFHTSNKKIWDFVNKFATFNNFVNRPKVIYKGKVYSFPINLFSLYQLWGCTSPEEAQKKINEVKVQIESPNNLEEWILSQVGEEIYHTFIYGYTKKQWGKNPSELPSFIIKRLPIRLTYDDNYFNDPYQGIPIGGYTKMIENMVVNIPIEKNVDFLKDIEYWSKQSKIVIYTGALDELFNYSNGELEYRSLSFEESILDIDDYQGNAIINYTDISVPYTRIVEHKHFDTSTIPKNKTIITREYPKKWSRGGEKYYPINDEKNNELYANYKNITTKEYPNYILGGRLSCYQYYDMHQIIGQAMQKFESCFV